MDKTTDQTNIKGKYRWNRLIAAGTLSLAAIFGAGWGIGAITQEPSQEEVTAMHAKTQLPSKGYSDLIMHDDWGDIDVQDAIHYMSHQKVEANQKWGSLEITKENVEMLDRIIETDKDKLIAYPVYRDILDRWLVGDFSEAVDDHNDMWELQDGNIGKATGLLHPDEEKEYVESTFGTRP